MLLPIFRDPLSPGVVEHVTGLHQTPDSLQTAMGITREREQAKKSRKYQEKVPTPRFGTSCTCVCQMAGATSQGIKPKEPGCARPGPNPAPAAQDGLAMPSSCLHEVQLTQKRANPAFHPQHMVAEGGLTPPAHRPCPAGTSTPVSSSVHQCHHITQTSSPQKATWHLGCVFLQGRA